MDFSAATGWWSLAGLLVAVELATGTFYLLMLALGAAGAALAAHGGLGGTAQIAVAALVGGGATAAWHLKRSHEPRPAPVESNRDVNLDIGQMLRVEAWAADGTARVSYRGAMWSVRHAGAAAPVPGEQVIVAVSGNELRVAPRS